MSLDGGGSIAVELIDKRLTGSNALDLWIFEIGPDLEDTFGAVSKHRSDPTKGVQRSGIAPE